MAQNQLLETHDHTTQTSGSDADSAGNAAHNSVYYHPSYAVEGLYLHNLEVGKDGKNVRILGFLKGSRQELDPKRPEDVWRKAPVQVLARKGYGSWALHIRYLKEGQGNETLLGQRAGTTVHLAQNIGYNNLVREICYHLKTLRSRVL